MNREALVRRLIITQNMTVDGAVEMLDDWFEPQAQADQSDLTEENRRQDRAADALLLGAAVAAAAAAPAVSELLGTHRFIWQ